MAAPKKALGQMIMMGLAGEEIGAEERSILKEYPFGGFLLFGRNLKEPGQILALCRSLRELGGEPPPFIAIDQEGGRVHRLPPPFTHFPAARRLGERANPELAYRAGEAAARELALAGINVDFAPVLDVDSNPRNPVIGDRSFGSDPARVAALAGAWSRGLSSGGIVPCGKHFPGHGDTGKDSHLELPVVEKSLADLKTVELPPFVAACRQGIESLMTAHVLYRALDPERPATLSRAVVDGLLRREIGYDGVVFSDDMEMKAIGASYSPQEAAGLAARAGVDVMLFCHDPAGAVGAYEHLRAAAEKDAAVRARIGESRRRIEKLKRRHLGKFTAVSERELARRLARLGHQKIVAEIYGSL